MRKSLKQVFQEEAPEWVSVKKEGFHTIIRCDDELFDQLETIRGLTKRRAAKREEAYLIPGEIEAARQRWEETQEPVDFHFGYFKAGGGFHGPRADFCLLAGSYDGVTLSLYFRAMNLVAGLVYDLVLAKDIIEMMGIEPEEISIFAQRAFIFPIDNAGMKLFSQLHMKVFKTKGFTPPQSKRWPNYWENFQ